MGRPKKEKTEQRQQIGFRLSPEDRQRLETAAVQAGRSVPQEVEERLIGSLDHDEAIDAPTRELLDNLLAEIATIQKLTGKRWHKDAVTWAAVHQMFRQGPLSWARPDRYEDDEAVAEAWREAYALLQERQAKVKELATLGIAVLEEPVIKTGMFGGRNSRDSERAAIESIDDEKVQGIARFVFDELLALDAKCKDASARHWDAVKPFRSAESSGRKMYQDHRRAIGLEAMRHSKPFFWSDLLPAPEWE